ncbi:hypothetical protein CAEBREN_16551 [Caenorhabditis brenneri]|uniref:F-box domain-containing protein n=1 Tax=Caenorhabditis brenneri TaxID=135651 RepID=G0N833_CAEBE|nr:hypothetical protein CAEBREN_16551 [Caenorhabditis brenneri]
MTPVTPSFPVLKLPYLAVKNVIKTMRISSMIYLAVCSKKMRSLVQSTFSKPNNMHIEIYERHLSLRVSGSICFEVAQIPTGQLRFQGRFRLKVCNMNLKDWFDLFMYAFRCDWIELASTSAWSHLRAAQLLEGREVSSLFLIHDNNDFIVKTLDMFMPTKELNLSNRPSKEEPYLRNIFTRNFDSIHLSFPISLEELCSINSASINIDFLSVKDFKKFLKNWVNGGNPRLQKLDVNVMKNDKKKKYMADYLSGIDINSFKIEEKDGDSWESFNIQRSDGTTAEVRIDDTHVRTHFAVIPKSN